MEAKYECNQEYFVKELAIGEALYSKALRRKYIVQKVVRYRPLYWLRLKVAGRAKN